MTKSAIESNRSEGRVAEGGGLEIRSGGNLSESSNPSLSANCPAKQDNWRDLAHQAGATGLVGRVRHKEQAKLRSIIYCSFWWKNSTRLAQENN